MAVSPRVYRIGVPARRRLESSSIVSIFSSILVHFTQIDRAVFPDRTPALKSV